LKPRNFAERKIPQSFSLEAGQILELREKAAETGKSLSELVREAVANFLQEVDAMNASTDKS
jgi:DNA-binding ferritin-like protein (Dps family)